MQLHSRCSQEKQRNIWSWYVLLHLHKTMFASEFHFLKAQQAAYWFERPCHNNRRELVPTVLFQSIQPLLFTVSFLEKDPHPISCLIVERGFSKIKSIEITAADPKWIMSKGNALIACCLSSVATIPMQLLHSHCYVQITPLNCPHNLDGCTQTTTHVFHSFRTCR